jgi:hypothetical protein
MTIVQEGTESLLNCHDLDAGIGYIRATIPARGVAR